MNLSKTNYARKRLNALRDRPLMRACRHPTDARRLTPADATSRCPPPMEPTGFEPATSALQTRRSPD